jgi:hypothetical protein
MPLSVHAAFLAAIAGAVTISAQGTARAQDVPALCTMVKPWFGYRSHGRHGSRYDLRVDMCGK